MSTIKMKIGEIEGKMPKRMIHIGMHITYVCIWKLINDIIDLYIMREVSEV